MCQANVRNCPSNTVNWLADKLDFYIEAFVTPAKGRDALIAFTEKVCEAVSAFLALAPAMSERAQAASAFGKSAKVLRGAGAIFGFPVAMRDAVRGWSGLFNSQSSINQLSGEQKIFYLASITATATFMTFMGVLGLADLAKKGAMVARMGKASPWIKLANSGTSLAYASTNVLSEENTKNLLRKQLHDKCNPHLTEEEKLVEVEMKIASMSPEKLQAELHQIRVVQGIKIVKEITDLLSTLVTQATMPYARQVSASFSLCTGALGLASEIYSTDKKRKQAKANEAAGLKSVRSKLEEFKKGTLTNGTTWVEMSPEAQHRLLGRGVELNASRNDE